MPSLRYRSWGDGVPRIPSFSFAGYLVAVLVGLFAGTMTFLALASLSSRGNEHVVSFHQAANSASEAVRFSITFLLFAFGPVALVGAVVLVPVIVWATEAGVRSAWATAVAGAAVTGLLVLVSTLLIARDNGSSAPIIVAFAFMPAGMVAALSYRAVTLYRFGGRSASKTRRTRTGNLNP